MAEGNFRWGIMNSAHFPELNHQIHDEEVRTFKITGVPK